ncbi:MAG: hypothetical protein Q8P13_04260 [bacterium]|nr:hypothetical protein [bacterium]
MQKTYLAIAIVSLLALGTVIYGFSLTGSPFDARGKQFDQTRVSNLSNLKYSIESYYNRNGKLPSTLSDLSSNTDYYYGSSRNSTKDPDTGKDYEYSVTSTTSYKLCATFSAPSETTAKSAYSYSNSSNTDFSHPKGRHCFSLTVSQNSSSYNYKSTTIQDSKIDYVYSNAEKNTGGNFPYGFFSLSTTEYGLINYSATPVTVTISFKKPVQLSSISNTFASCLSSACYTWSASGVTNQDKTLVLVKNTAVSSATSTKAVSTDEKIKILKITAAPATTGYLYWKKIKISYVSD